MAIKKPLVRYEDTGDVEELRAADTVSGTQIFVQDAAPTGTLPSKYLWVQTNMGAGEDITFWVEDGD